MTTLEVIEARTAEAMFKQHTDANRTNGKKCVCNYCETFRKFVTLFTNINKKSVNYNR